MASDQDKRVLFDIGSKKDARLEAYENRPATMPSGDLTTKRGSPVLERKRPSNDTLRSIMRKYIRKLWLRNSFTVGIIIILCALFFWWGTASATPKTGERPPATRATTTTSTTTSTTTTTTTTVVKQKATLPAQTIPPRQITPASGNCEQWRELVAKHFPAEQVNNALLVMSKESGCDPSAKSSTNDHGLMQVHFPAHKAKVNGDVNALYDPETNIIVARQIYGSGSWKPWYAVCPKNGSNPYGIC